MRRRVPCSLVCSPKLARITVLSETGRTHIGVVYVFNKSRPFKLALMKVGPRAGTRYMVARSAKMENPTET